jgi:hypothetical protein
VDFAFKTLCVTVSVSSINPPYLGCFDLLDCDFKTLCEASLFIFTNPLSILDGVSTCWIVPLNHFLSLLINLKGTQE